MCIELLESGRVVLMRGKDRVGERKRRVQKRGEYLRPTPRSIRNYFWISRGLTIVRNSSANRLLSATLAGFIWPE